MDGDRLSEPLPTRRVQGSVTPMAFPLSGGPRTGPRVPAHQLTTRNLGAAYPLVAESGLGHRGVLVGHDLLGGSFVYDPFELYAQGVVSNPNMIVFGQIGRGRSAFVKTYLWRQAVFGRRAWVVDPKGEYGVLADAWGTAPIALRPGAAPGAGDSPDRAEGRQVELLASLAAACLGRGLLPRERVAVDLALASVGGSGQVPTLPAVVETMVEPTPESAGAVRTDRATLLEDGRDVALELRRLVHGDLRGMFDGPTTPGLDLSGPWWCSTSRRCTTRPPLGADGLRHRLAAGDAGPPGLRQSGRRCPHPGGGGRKLGRVGESGRSVNPCLRQRSPSH
jgi:hypothetical protein